MTYTITVETLPSFMMDIAQRLQSQKTIIVDYINQEDLYINSDDYKNDPIVFCGTWEEWLSILDSIIAKNANTLS